MKSENRNFYEEWRSLKSAIAKCRKAAISIGSVKTFVPDEYNAPLSKEQIQLIDSANRLEHFAKEIINL